ncbi:hypothetical protein Aperf_G00000132908 [Anoplocephala perfoliata]
MQNPRHSQGHQHRHQDQPQHHQSQQKGSLQLWRFLVTMLDDPASQHLICWAGRKLEFKLNEPEEVARLWGIQKNRPTMNYDKLSRSLRYYYEKGIISKVSGERYVYRFAYEPEILAKLTLDETLSSVIPSKTSKNWRPTTSAAQEVVFPPPPKPIPSQQITPVAQSTLASPPLSSPPQPLPSQAIPLQEMAYQPQWGEQIIYPSHYDYEWNETYVPSNVPVSYPINQQYDYSYTYDQMNQVYSTDIDTDNCVLFEYPEYF